MPPLYRLRSAEQIKKRSPPRAVRSKDADEQPAGAMACIVLAGFEGEELARPLPAALLKQQAYACAAQAQLAAAAAKGGLRVQAKLDADTACDVCVAKNVLSATYAARCRRFAPLRRLSRRARRLRGTARSPSSRRPGCTPARRAASRLLRTRWRHTSCLRLRACASASPAWKSVCADARRRTRCCTLSRLCLLADERQVMKENTERNGGAYYAELTKAKCTHLVAASADSDKYRHALRWRSVKIVSPAWFEQSVAAKRAPGLRACLLAAPPSHTLDVAQCASLKHHTRSATRTMPLKLPVRLVLSAA